MKKRYISMLILFGSALALFMIISILTQAPSENITDAEALNGFDFSSSLARLNPSCFERYPDALYTPEDFAEGRVTQSPSEEHPAMEHGHTTYRLILSLTPGRIYGIYGATPTYASTLWIDGEVYSEMGTVGTNAEETSAKTGWLTVYFSAGEQTEIIIRRSDYVHASGGQLYPLYIGEQPLVTAMANGVMFRVTFIVGVTIMAALFAFGIFLSFTERKHFLWFALACVMITVRTLIVDHKVIMTLFPEMIWTISHRTEYVATLVFNLFLFMYITRMFRMRVRHPVNLFGITILILYTPIVLLAPSLVYTAAMRGFRLAAVVFGTLFFILILREMYKKSETRRTEHILIMSGTLFYIVMILVDIFFHQFHKIGETNYVQLGMLVFITANTVALSLDFARTETAYSVVNQLSRMKSEYLADMSHELNTPLAVITMGIEFSKMSIEKGNTENAMEALDTAKNETLRVGRMVDGMLKSAAMSDGGKNRQRVNFAEMLKSCAEAYRIMLEKKKNRLEINIAPNLPDVFVEADGFTQVITNILSNAARHTRGGEVIINAEKKGSFITVEITDSGEGISPEFLPKAFERGESDSDGTGYGLYLCKVMIEAHGGTIKIESEQNKGTTVTFTVPVYGGQEAGHRR